MTSRPLTRPRAQARPQAGEKGTTGQPREAIARLRHALTEPLLTGPLQAPARARAGRESMTGQSRGAVTGLVRAWVLAGEQA